MEKIFDVCVIGGGASGLVCAIKCAEQGKSVCIVEKFAKLGKKILITGNGRCNLSNKNISVNFYNNKIVDKVFASFSKDHTIKFFKSIGIETFADTEGRIYPISETASSVANAFILKLESLRVETFCGEEVLTAKKENGVFQILTASKKLISKNVVVACGASSAKNIFANCGHKFLPFQKVLVGLECEKGYDKKLSGLRLNCEVNCKIGNNVFKEIGQVQFKENGISGIVIFNLSAFATKFGKFPFSINLNLLPKLDKETLKQILLDRIKNNNYFNIENILLGILPDKISINLLKKLKINNLKLNINNFNEKMLNNLIENIFNYNLKIINTLGEPQVLCGGFDLAEFGNLQSNKIKGLFVCGEACGVFGYSGGYNLQWAWSSGVFASKQIAEEK